MKHTYFRMGNVPRLLAATLLFGALSSSYSWSQQLRQNTTMTDHAALKKQSSVVVTEKPSSFEGYTPDQEVVGKRAKNVKHFSNPDGTYTAQVGGNYHYKDEKGNWQDIDLNIEKGVTGLAGYAFKNVKNDVKSYFPQYAGTEGVLMQLENGTEFVWWKQPQFRTVSNGNAVKQQRPFTVMGQVSGEKLTYEQLYNNISEEFVALNGGVENNIILHGMTPELTSLSSGSVLEFSQFIPLQNGWKILNAEGRMMTGDFQTTDFSVQLGNADSKIYFGRILVFDNAISKDEAMLVNMPVEKLSQQQKQQLEQSVYTVSYKIKFVNGGVEVISALPADWLKVAGRSFPVTIDPTVTITPSSSAGSYQGPMTHWYGYQRHASLYLQSEIGIFGTITDIEYNRTGAGAAGSRPTRVYMRTTVNATLTAGAWNSANYTSGAQLCLDQNTDQGSTVGWKNLPLTSPFVYGQDNLVVMVYDSWGGSGSTKNYNQSTAVAGRQVTNKADITDPGEGAGLAVENRLTEIRITYVPSTECTGLPSSITATASATAVCLNTPYTLSLTGLAVESGFSIQWQSSTNGGGTWNDLGSPQTSTTYSVTGQTTATDYRAVVTCVPTGDEVTSTVVTVGQNPPSQCYCINAIAYNCTDGDVITNVTIESINNNSTCGSATTGYSDYTTSVSPAQLQAGTTVPISVTVGPSGDGWLYESVGLWIDYNQNGVLDSLEGEYTNVGTGLNQVLTANVVIPSTALPGLTRMRVVVSASIAMQNAFVCGPLTATENYGEMEDYTVNILDNSPVVVDSVIVTTQGGVPAQITTPAGTLQLVATVYPLTVNQNVTWSVIPVSGAATISATGLVTAQADGTIWAKAVSVADVTKADSILITITNQTIGVDSVVVTTQGGAPAQITVPTGTLQLVATVYPLTVNQNVTWSVFPVSGAATVSATGLVTAQGNGTVWVKAVSVADVTKADSILITISNQDLGVSTLNLSDFAMYPNPTTDFVTLSSAEEHSAMDLIVTDLTGKILFSDRLIDNALHSGYQLQLGEYSSGVYILRLTGSTSNIQRNIIKQ